MSRMMCRPRLERPFVNCWVQKAKTETPYLQVAVVPEPDEILRAPSRERGPTASNAQNWRGRTAIPKDNTPVVCTLAPPDNSTHLA